MDWSEFFEGAKEAFSVLGLSIDDIIKIAISRKPKLNILISVGQEKHGKGFQKSIGHLLKLIGAVRAELSEKLKEKLDLSEKIQVEFLIADTLQAYNDAIDDNSLNCSRRSWRKKGRAWKREVSDCLKNSGFNETLSFGNVQAQLTQWDELKKSVEYGSALKVLEEQYRQVTPDKKDNFFVKVHKKLNTRFLEKMRSDYLSVKSDPDQFGNVKKKYNLSKNQCKDLAMLLSSSSEDLFKKNVRELAEKHNKNNNRRNRSNIAAFEERCSAYLSVKSDPNQFDNVKKKYNLSKNQCKDLAMLAGSSPEDLFQKNLQDLVNMHYDRPGFKIPDDKPEPRSSIHRYKIFYNLEELALLYGGLASRDKEYNQFLLYPSDPDPCFRLISRDELNLGFGHMEWVNVSVPVSDQVNNRSREKNKFGSLGAYLEELERRISEVCANDFNLSNRSISFFSGFKLSRPDQGFSSFRYTFRNLDEKRIFFERLEKINFGFRFDLSGDDFQAYSPGVPVLFKKLGGKFPFLENTSDECVLRILEDVFGAVFFVFQFDTLDNHSKAEAFLRRLRRVSQLCVVLLSSQLEHGPEHVAHHQTNRWRGSRFLPDEARSRISECFCHFISKIEQSQILSFLLYLDPRHGVSAELFKKVVDVERLRAIIESKSFFDGCDQDNFFCENDVKRIPCQLLDGKGGEGQQLFICNRFQEVFQEELTTAYQSSDMLRIRNLLGYYFDSRSELFFKDYEIGRALCTNIYFESIRCRYIIEIIRASKRQFVVDPRTHALVSAMIYEEVCHEREYYLGWDVGNLLVSLEQVPFDYLDLVSVLHRKRLEQHGLLFLEIVAESFGNAPAMRDSLTRLLHEHILKGFVGPCFGEYSQNIVYNLLSTKLISKINLNSVFPVEHQTIKMRRNECGEMYQEVWVEYPSYNPFQFFISLCFAPQKLLTPEFFADMAIKILKNQASERCRELNDSLKFLSGICVENKVWSSDRTLASLISDFFRSIQTDPAFVRIKKEDPDLKTLLNCLPGWGVAQASQNQSSMFCSNTSPGDDRKKAPKFGKKSKNKK